MIPHPVSTDAVLDALRAADLLVHGRGTLPPSVTSVTDDSRQVKPGMLFIAVHGHDRDGHDYLDAAARAGAIVAVVEDEHRTTLPAMVVRDGRRAAAIVAAVAYGHPAASLQLIAVTGTNGKTTTVGMLRHLFHEDSAPAASIGTLGVLIGSEGVVLPGGGGLTTPGPVELQRLLRVIADRRARYVAMEVSSHSLAQRRVDGLAFQAAVFTNITRDHLDYHGTMESYVASKFRLTSYLTAKGTAVVNADDAVWRDLPAAPRRVTFGTTAQAEVRADRLTPTSRGSAFELLTPGAAGVAVELPLLGEFNVANALGAAAAAWALGMSPTDIAARLSSMPQVPGRLERVLERPVVLRDYAHTPDALERALDAVRPFVEGRLLVVFGCGGDRDRGKRPLMGAIAEKKGDLAIVTSDNPRTEDPERILDDIERGMTRPHERIEDRRRAIARALELAKPNDVVVLAGKGHETYQIRGTSTLPFDERAIVQELSLAMGLAS